MNIKKRIPTMVAERLRAIFAWKVIVQASGTHAPVTTLPIEPETDRRECASWQGVHPNHVNWTAIQDCRDKTLLKFVNYPKAF